MAASIFPSFLIGFAVFLVSYGAFRAKFGGSIADRLKAFSSREEAPERAGVRSKGRHGPVSDRLDKALSRQGFAAKISSDLARADIKMTVTEFLLVRVVSVGGGLFLGIVLGRQMGWAAVLIALGTGFVGFVAPKWAIKFKQHRRITAFNKQLPDGILLLSSSLRAGYSLLQSMELVSREGNPPLSVELGRVVKEVGLGLSSEEALANLLRRVPSDDLDLLITAINIQHEVGGNLAQMLEIIGQTIRERVRIKGEISVLTAQQRGAAYILTGLPIGITAALMVMGGDYMRDLFTFPWIGMPICSGIMIFIGFMVIRKIVAIEV